MPNLNFDLAELMDARRNTTKQKEYYSYGNIIDSIKASGMKAVITVDYSIVGQNKGSRKHFAFNIKDGHKLPILLENITLKDARQMAEQLTKLFLTKERKKELKRLAKNYAFQHSKGSKNYLWRVCYDDIEPQTMYCQNFRAKCSILPIIKIQAVPMKTKISTTQAP